MIYFINGLVAKLHYHPTLAEIWTYPAEELAAETNLKARILFLRRLQK